MKNLVLTLSLFAMPALAHEGHDHGTPAPTTPAHGGHDHGNPAPVPTPPATPENTAPVPDFHEMVAHFSFPKLGVHAHTFWKQEPKFNDDATLRIEFRDANEHKLINPSAKPSVSLSHEDLGFALVEPVISPVLDSKGQALVGVYDVTSILFMKGGTWELRLVLTVEDGTEHAQVLKTLIVSNEKNPMNDPKSPLHIMMHGSNGGPVRAGGHAGHSMPH